MIIGAKDEIDQLLVDKYSSIQVNKIDNTNMINTIMSPDKVMDIMDDYAQVKKTVLQIQGKFVHKKFAMTGLQVAMAYAKS